jgi:hypothetical protein
MTNTERSEAKLDKVYNQEIVKWPAAVEWMTRAKDTKVNQEEGGKKGEAGGTGKKAEEGRKGKQTEVSTKEATSAGKKKVVLGPKEMNYRREFWALIPQGIYDWRTHSGNRGRDYKRFAKVALIEQSDVEGYRAELFEHSAAARLLRVRFREAMKGLCVD